MGFKRRDLQMDSRKKPRFLNDFQLDLVISSLERGKWIRIRSYKNSDFWTIFHDFWWLKTGMNMY